MENKTSNTKQIKQFPDPKIMSAQIGSVSHNC